MKKVSTAIRKQGRNISRQTLTIGLDLGDRNSWYCVLDEAGQIQLEERVRTNAKALQQVFGAMPRSRIALETGTHSPWISRLLSELGHEVIVGNRKKFLRIVLTRIPFRCILRTSSLGRSINSPARFSPAVRLARHVFGLSPRSEVSDSPESKR